MDVTFRSRDSAETERFTHVRIESLSGKSRAITLTAMKFVADSEPVDEDVVSDNTGSQVCNAAENRGGEGEGEDEGEPAQRSAEELPTCNVDDPTLKPPKNYRLTLWLDELNDVFLDLESNPTLVYEPSEIRTIKRKESFRKTFYRLCASWRQKTSATAPSPVIKSLRSSSSTSRLQQRPATPLSIPTSRPGTSQPQLSRKTSRIFGSLAGCHMVQKDEECLGA